ncbi:hypothetical protein [Natronobacterium gregoryi]|uniref:Uncharacterized protein n=2 Tax=Natronobacterium gregoryi TaxID=44930 RepID=L0AFZ5_NATGS|nr:hypothetical protein [Natronobacterium gregoryi]AFZ71985.1 hypothetical protein Natgr_0743 [Natronobacterium gregoryi SP2]ELY62651.1 hypothetical protein C490_17549 [Natronobacterium gregoryi SP2]PLK20840.1 hypothetical protein CYV19_07100 [Natronobacterium gregoryi SP2]SFJ19504.1 hypothetical protein SAMN05443661_11723 [Natronobacterium gregoryi]
MTTTRTVALLAVVAVVGLAITSVAAGAVANSSTSVEPDASESNATVGTVMQMTAADAEHSIESQLFDVSYEQSPEERRADLVADRTTALESEVERLESEQAALRDLQETNETPTAYQARMAKLAVEINALEHEIERTKPRAAATDLGKDRLETLERNTSGLVNAEVNAVARSVPGLDRQSGGVAMGPPTDRNTANETPGQGMTPPGQNGTATPPGQNDDAAPGAGDGPAQNGTAPGGVDEMPDHGPAGNESESGGNETTPADPNEGTDADSGEEADGESPGQSGDDGESPGQSGDDGESPGQSGDDGESPGQSGDDGESPGQSGDDGESPGQSGDDGESPGQSGGDDREHTR